MPAKKRSSVKSAKSTKPALLAKSARWPFALVNRRRLWVLLMAGGLLLIVGAVVAQPPAAASSDITDLPDPGLTLMGSDSLKQEFRDTITALSDFEDAEARHGAQVVPGDVISRRLSAITLDFHIQNFPKAHEDLTALTSDLSRWRTQFDQALADTTPGFLDVPILIYHHTPPDFEAQLQNLLAKGYTTVDLGQVVGALHHEGALPAKPVVITFDDGYTDQLQAFDLLRQYNLKATFYIIDGGPLSSWCIGAGRRYHDPAQPAGGCGDAYLTWDQVRDLDHSGLVTVGSHTVDHLELSSLPADQQWTQISQGKAVLEAQLGHAVYDFAYPYGGFNATTIEQVERAGFRSAVTTLPGESQTFGSQYQLHRVRSAYELP
ncbi:MAG TPA: polysaccharide deacetylase family protein [Candidatus Saccharimonas sp.]|nr:polysaccharide deacetylase family protein [Candidatus Saccharimonas sp.]